jgi:uracil-DNA glycosylase
MTCRDVSEFLGPGWASRLRGEFESQYIEDLQGFLRTEYQAQKLVFPPKERIFRALQLVDYDAVRVVILGQDPYHGEGQANGLAFAVENGMKMPPSLLNIYKEISSDLGGKPPRDTSLEGWARQGVLLLNTVLTVRAHEAFSHRGRGWETFTHRVVEELNRREESIVFMLWGAPAQQKASVITNPNHLVLKSPHPSPLSAHRGFLGCRHFSQANQFLSRSQRAINWFEVT